MNDEVVLKAEEARAIMPARAPMVPLAFIGGGVLLLVANLAGVHLMNFLWPGFIILPALALLWPAYRSTPTNRSQWSFLAVPGAMMLTVGIMLLAMSLTDYFESWAYAWPLVLAGTAAGFSYMRRFEPEHRVHGRAQRFIRGCVTLTMIMLAFFELLIFQSLGPWWPLALVVYGLYLWRKNSPAAG